MSLCGGPQTQDEAALPLSINCWPSTSGSESFVNIEYESTVDFDLHNLVVAIPVSQAPRVNQVTSEFAQPGIHPFRLSNWLSVVPMLCVLDFFPLSVRNLASFTSLHFLVSKPMTQMIAYKQCFNPRLPRAVSPPPHPPKHAKGMCASRRSDTSGGDIDGLLEGAGRDIVVPSARRGPL
jgi:hypothetical protein